MGSQAQPAAAPAPAAAPRLEPPRVLEAPLAPYPETAPRDGAGAPPSARVRLQVTLDAQGAVTAATVLDSAGPELDESALATIKTWKFAPATRDGQPIAATVPVDVSFAPPSETAPELPSPAAAAAGAPDAALPAPAVAPAATSSAAAPPEPPASADAESKREPPAPRPPPAPLEPEEGEEYSARGVADAAQLRSRERGPADVAVERDVLEAAPHRDAADMLRTVPGVYVARSEGNAVASSITLRGFDAEHGQDIEMLVDGVPINQPSHLHGQGYADLGFLLPEVVREIRVTEGVYDPRQGDFATAGTIDFRLGVEERGVHSLTSYGSFDTVRQALIYAPEGTRPDSFGAVSYRKTSGFGENRGGADAELIAQQGFGEGPTRYRATAMLSGARYAQAGVLRRDDVNDGRVDFYDVYPFATAEAQNALSARSQLSFGAEHRGAEGDNTDFLLWTTYNDFRLQENYTGFLQRSQHDPEWVGRGDLIEQTNEQLSFGGRARHRTAPYRPHESVSGTIEIGMASRLDLIDQTQNLIAAPQNETWDQRVDASITGADIGAWLDLDWKLARVVSLRGGFRVDALFYDVNDRLGNLTPAFRSEEHIEGFRRSAFGIAAGPRVSTEVRIFPWLSALAAYGEGYRSPQARTLSDGESAPFAKVKSADVGARARLLPGDALELMTSAFWTHLGEDVAFDAAEGRLEPIGPTTRLGVVASGKAQPTSWSLLNASLTVVRATLDEPPPATAESPSPPFEEGSALPFVAPVTLRIDAAVTPELTRFGDAPLRGRAGIGYSYLSPRPLPFGDQAEPVSLFDALVGARYRALELTLECQNLLGSEYAAEELNFVSNWDPGGVPSRVPERHFAAGAPRTFLATFGVHL
jgi:TonB family protein